MADETKQIDVFMGPYRGNRLVVSAADADAAVNAHWSRDPHSGEAYGTGHDPLSDDERAAALEAATTWAKAQWDTAQQVPPPEGTPVRRDMKPDEGGKYPTRNIPDQPDDGRRKR